MNWRHSLTTLGIAFLVAACGGGDDNASDSTGASATGEGARLAAQFRPAAQDDGSPAVLGREVVILTGQVVDADGAPLAGVSVTFEGVTTDTDAQGHYRFEVAASSAARTVVQFTKTGMAPLAGVAQQPPLAGALIEVNAHLQPIGHTFEPFDADSAQVLAMPEGVAALSLPGRALRRENGTPITGQAVAQLTPVASGALQVRLTESGGAALNLQFGARATVRIPLGAKAQDASSLPAEAPLYGFDEQMGVWRQEGSATLVGRPPFQYYEGVVPHLGTWRAGGA